MENVVDKDVKSHLVKIELTGDVSNRDEILNTFKFSCNSINNSNDLLKKRGFSSNEEIFSLLLGCNNITDYRIPIMKVNLMTLNNSNSTAPDEIDSIYFYNLVSCNESRFLSGCGKGNGKFEINYTIENLDLGKYQLIIERMGLKYIEDINIT